VGAFFRSIFTIGTLNTRVRVETWKIN
jgi:hypothetical protein